MVIGSSPCLGFFQPHMVQDILHFLATELANTPSRNVAVLRFSSKYRRQMGRYRVCRPKVAFVSHFFNSMDALLSLQ